MTSHTSLDDATLRDYLLGCLNGDDAPEAPEASEALRPLRQLRRIVEGAHGYLGLLKEVLDVAPEVLLERIVHQEPSQEIDPTSTKGRAGGLAEGDRERIFLIHGRDWGRKESVARYLEKLGAEVFVLQELPNEGKTVIEKLESYAGVRYAVALLTGDDHGGLRRRQRSPKPTQRRPRQNVLFELGYFLRHLGRGRVCVLRDPDIEIPSDIEGVLTITLDDRNAWRWSLARELKAAGLHLDLSRIL